jgi:general stress protein 26
MESISFCMLATHDGEQIRARPMAAYVRRNESLVYFLTDADRPKDEEVARNPHVNLAFADAGKQTYVSVSGTASLSNDRQKIGELFNTAAKAWWDSPEDPSIRLLTVTPLDAEYWDSPGKVASYIRMAMAAMSDSRPDMGKHDKVRMS